MLRKIEIINIDIDNIAIGDIIQTLWNDYGLDVQENNDKMSYFIRKVESIKKLSIYTRTEKQNKWN